MRDETAEGLSALIKGKKEILWLGNDESKIAQTLGASRNLARFVSFSQIKKLKVTDDLSLVVVAPGNGEIDNKSVEKLKKFVVKKILLVSETVPRESLSSTLAQVNFHKIVIDSVAGTVGSSDLALAIEEARRNHGGDNGGEESQPPVSRTKALVTFVKNLSAALSIQDVLKTLREELRSFQAVNEPLLVFVNAQNDLAITFFQGAQILERKIKEAWPQQPRVRLNDFKDSQYLANIFGRPFAKLLAIPLRLRYLSTEHSLKVGAVLYFEHGLSESEANDFLQHIEERLEPLSIAIDRLLVEQYLKDVSRLWEKTFDGLKDPVAIFDADGQILRANRAFAERLIDVQSPELMAETLKHRDHDYQVHSYPITFGLSVRPTNIINHYVDVTISNRLKKQMIQSEKMAALGHLAGNIAHELNNPLTGVRSLAQILITQVKPGTTLLSDLTEVEKAAERCQEVIQNLLEFSTGGYEKRQQNISLKSVVQKTLPLIKTLTSRYDVETDFIVENDDVFVEPRLLQHVVFNLIKNACEAMGESGTLTLKTHIETSSTDKFIVLSVIDTGVGVELSAQTQIFDFFYTTKNEGQGTGLGLSMSKNIIERFGGMIKLNSTVGIGSEFQIWLPANVTAATTTDGETSK